MILGLFSCLGFYPIHNFIFFWTILTNHEWSWLPFILCWSCSIYFIQPSPSNKAKNIPQVHMRFKHIIWNFKRSHVWGKKFWSHGRKFSILQHLPLRYSSSKNSARSTNLSYVFVFSNINIFLLGKERIECHNYNITGCVVSDLQTEREYIIGAHEYIICLTLFYLQFPEWVN